MKDVPLGWLSAKFEDFVVLQRGFDLTKSQSRQGLVPVVSSSGVSYYHDTAMVEPPGIVTGRKGSLGKVWLIDVAFWPHDTTLWVKDFKGNFPPFVKLFLERMNLARFDAATSVPTLNRNTLNGIRVAIPPLDEQRRITGIISEWDRAIELTERLVGAKQKMKLSLSQQLLKGKVRFAEFVKSGVRHQTLLGELPVDWAAIRFGEIVKKIKRKNTVDEDHVLTASGEFGLVDQREFFNRSVAGKDLSKYYLLKRGDFAYNRSAMKGYPYGAIKRLDRYEQGVLSTLYFCFELIDQARCDSDYLCHFFEGRLFDRQLRRITQVGGRAHGLLNITDGDFYSISIVLPSIEEQERIAAVLTTQDLEIEKLKEKLEALKEQKKGLMQKLLTGRIRVAEAACP